MAISVKETAQSFLKTELITLSPYRAGHDKTRSRASVNAVLLKYLQRGLSSFA